MKTITITLDIPMPTGEDTQQIYPVLIKTSRDIILVDCGYIGSLSLIEKAMHQHGIDPKGVTAIVLTHHDHDHMGAAAAFKSKYPQVKLYASKLEEPYISASAKPLRLVQAEEMQNKLPAEAREFGRAFCALLRRVEPVQIDGLLHDNEELLGSGYRVVATPGHTPGHISLYSKKQSTVIAGDAMALENNQLVIANPQFTLDARGALTSMSKLLALGAQTIICYHGGTCFPGENSPEKVVQ